MNEYEYDEDKHQIIEKLKEVFGPTYDIGTFEDLMEHFYQTLNRAYTMAYDQAYHDCKGADDED